MGFGIMKYENGVVYIGEWWNGEMNGEGTMIWSDGSVYTGNFKHGLYHGSGTYLSMSETEDLTLYVGDFFEEVSDGFGKGHNDRGGAQANIPLPPQDFYWGDILPNHERTDSNSREDNFMLRVYSNIKLRDFRKMWEAYQLVLPVKSPTLVSKYLDGDSPSAVIKWIPKMLEYHEKDILEDWFEVTETLRIIEGNNALNDKELKTMFRGTFEDYVKDPLNTEKPSKEDIFWVFNQLIEEFNSF